MSNRDRPHVLGKALARCLSAVDGEWRACLPDGVDRDLAAAIARHANELRPVSPPYAILVASERILEQLPDDYISVDEAIQYRFDDRLAVVSGKHDPKTSFDKVFELKLSAGFPDSVASGLSLEDLAREAVAVVAEHGGVDSNVKWNEDAATARLSHCLHDLAAIFRALRQGSAAWNTQWIAHVQEGLDILASALAQTLVGAPDSDFDRWWESYTYPAFGLPRPKGPTSLLPAGGGALGGAVAGALDEWWSSTAKVGDALTHLAAHPDTEPGGGPHALAALDWTSLDRELAAYDNQMRAFARVANASDEGLDALSKLTAKQFFSPLNVTATERRVVLADVSGALLAAGTSKTTPFLIPVEGAVPGEASSGGRSRTLLARIPLASEPPAAACDASTLGISMSAGLTWVVENRAFEAVDGQVFVVLSGHVTWEAGTSLGTEQCTLRVSVEDNDPLRPLLPAGANCKVHFLLLGLPGALWVKSSGAGLGCVDQLVDPIEGPVLCELEANQDYTIFAWGAPGDAAPQLNSAPLEQWYDDAAVWRGPLKPAGEDILQAGTLAVRFDAPEPEHPSKSPIISAIWNRSAATGDLAPTTLASLRGQYEGALVARHGDPEWAQANGHWLLVVDEGTGIGEPEAVAGGAFLAPPDVAASWAGARNFIPPAELVTSSQAHDFRAAFDGLAVADHLEFDPTLDRAPRLPSQASWRDLWSPSRDPLARYLAAYAELLHRAREIDDPAGIFWAAYPWSVSVWSAGDCEAVLLSPLHPVRLAWVAAAEGVLWDTKASVASALAGTVEGWNLPLIGPRTSRKGRMVATPIDNGEGQVFLGWSMLVAASIDDAKPLKPPVEAGRFKLPGSSASGLNAGGVDSALRDFHRVNPHVTTLTIDLAAGNAAELNRLPEIDEAVLQALESWAKAPAGKADLVPAVGIRVLDSVKRVGEPPSSSVARFVMDHPSIPVSWSRYSSRPGESAVCNVRLLQDAGLRLELGTGESQHGVVADAPLRRFEPVPSARLSGGRVRSHPALGDDAGWQPFVDAIRSLESADECPSIAAEIDHSLLGDANADWTVAGEAIVGPSALAHLVATGGGDAQMLWEWRPPFLSGDVGKRGESLAVLERRPFLSVVRVPAVFRQQIAALLRDVSGKGDADDDAAAMLADLGTRGVGLSSLTAIGGTHSAGALGFHLAMSLLDRVRLDGKELFVLPIDACDPFLRVLGPGTGSGSARRADLLVLAVSQTHIQLLPVEIKMYGLLAGGAAGLLPGPDSSDVRKAVEQVAATVGVLDPLVERGLRALDAPSAAESILWRNAFMALVEAGIRMGTRELTNPTLVLEAVRALAAGDTHVTLADPVVCFLSHGGRGPSGEACQTYRDEQHPSLSRPFGLFSANPSAVLEAIRGEAASECTEAWAELMAWALRDTTSPAVVEGGTGKASEGAVGASATQTAPADVADTENSSPVSQTGDEDASADSEALPAERPQGGTPSPPGASPPAQLPDCDDGVRFPVGTYLSSVGQSLAEFWPSSTALTQMNIGVVGDLGTGKTQLLKAIMYRLREGTRRCQERAATMLVFDYKIDYQDQDFLQAVDGRVLAPTRIPLNVFALPGDYTPIAAVQVARNFIDVLGKIYSGIGPVQRDNLTTVVTDLFGAKNGRSPTLSEVVEEYRKRVGGVDAASAVMNQFVLGGVFSEDESELVTFDELMDGSLLVVALDQFGNDQQMKNALVVMLLNQYYDYMRRQPKVFWTNQDGVQLRNLNSFLLVDEALNIMRYEFQVLQDLMLQGREFGVGTILASQYLTHFRQRGTNYGEPLRSWFIHRVSGVVRQQLVALGIAEATDAMAVDLAGYAAHEALYVTEGVPGRAIRGFPFYELRP